MTRRMPKAITQDAADLLHWLARNDYETTSAMVDDEDGVKLSIEGGDSSRFDRIIDALNLLHEHKIAAEIYPRWSLTAEGWYHAFHGLLEEHTMTKQLKTPTGFGLFSMLDHSTVEAVESKLEIAQVAANKAFSDNAELMRALATFASVGAEAGRPGRNRYQEIGTTFTLASCIHAYNAIRQHGVFLAPEGAGERIWGNWRDELDRWLRGEESMMEPRTEATKTLDVLSFTERRICMLLGQVGRSWDQLMSLLDHDSNLYGQVNADTLDVSLQKLIAAGYVYYAESPVAMYYNTPDGWRYAQAWGAGAEREAAQEAGAEQGEARGPGFGRLTIGQVRTGPVTFQEGGTLTVSAHPDIPQQGVVLTTTEIDVLHVLGAGGEATVHGIAKKMTDSRKPIDVVIALGSLGKLGLVASREQQPANNPTHGLTPKGMEEYRRRYPRVQVFTAATPMSAGEMAIMEKMATVFRAARPNIEAITGTLVGDTRIGTLTHVGVVVALDALVTRGLLSRHALDQFQLTPAGYQWYWDQRVPEAAKEAVVADEPQEIQEVGAFVKQALDKIRTELAAIEHARWADWQAYFFSKCDRDADGDLTVPAGYARALEKLIATPFDQLDARQQANDMAEIDRYWPLLAAWLTIGLTVGLMGPFTVNTVFPAVVDDTPWMM